MTAEQMAWVGLVFASIPALLFTWNMFLYREPCAADEADLLSISVLIPARNEERSIAACVHSVLQSQGVALEVLVLDDDSEDATAAVVEQIASRDERVRLIRARHLPAGWCGKQHACAVLAEQATCPLLCFLDADVRITPVCLGRLAAELRSRELALLSGFPWQETIGFAEWLLLPLMHFVLLGYLPLFATRRTLDPAFGAGCGQIFLADHQAYLKAGGHGAIRASKHDGIMLPKAFRRAGLRTDLCDVTKLASCRMYRSAADVFRGLFKNATEGMASPGRILPFTVLLGLGQVLPVALFLSKPSWVSGIAMALSYLPRVLATVRFRQVWKSAALHPLGVLMLLCIQWAALIHLSLRRPNTWKGRSYSPDNAA